ADRPPGVLRAGRDGRAARDAGRRGDGRGIQRRLVRGRPRRGAAPVTGPDLRDWISRHLDPLDDRAADAARRSDFDLSPGWTPDPGELTPAAVLVGLIEREEGLTVL